MSVLTPPRIYPFSLWPWPGPESAPSDSKDAQREPKGPQRDPKDTQKPSEGSQRKAKGTRKGAKVAPKEVKNAQGKSEGPDLYFKLPINRPSGRYVTYIYSITNLNI